MDKSGIPAHAQFTKTMPWFEAGFSGVSVAGGCSNCPWIKLAFVLWGFLASLALGLARGASKETGFILSTLSPGPAEPRHGHHMLVKRRAERLEGWRVVAWGL